MFCRSTASPWVFQFSMVSPKACFSTGFISPWPFDQTTTIVEVETKPVPTLQVPCTTQQQCSLVSAAFLIDATLRSPISS